MKKIFTAKELKLSRDSESPVSEKDLNRIAADISDMVRTALVKNEQVIRRKTHGKSGESLEASIENLVEDICREISAAIERKGYEDDYGALHWDSRRPWEQSVVAHVRRIASGDSAAPVKEDKAQSVAEASSNYHQSLVSTFGPFKVYSVGSMATGRHLEMHHGNVRIPVRDDSEAYKRIQERGGLGYLMQGLMKDFWSEYGDHIARIKPIDKITLPWFLRWAKNHIAELKDGGEDAMAADIGRAVDRVQKMFASHTVAEARYQPTDAEARKWAKGWTVRMPFIPDAGTRHFGSEEEAVRYVDSKMGGFDAVVAFDGRAVKKKSAFGGWTKIEA